MRHRYVDQTPSAAALMLPAVLHIRGHPDLRRSLQAKIDTAADMVAIPRSFTSASTLVKWGERRIRQTGRIEPTYLVEVELDNVLYSVEATVHDGSYILIGRDILNQLTLIADGPKETFELIHPKP
jgi:hypothetical protein